MLTLAEFRLLLADSTWRGQHGIDLDDRQAAAVLDDDVLLSELYLASTRRLRAATVPKRRQWLPLAATAALVVTAGAVLALAATALSPPQATPVEAASAPEVTGTTMRPSPRQSGPTPRPTEPIVSPAPPPAPQPAPEPALPPPAVVSAPNPEPQITCPAGALTGAIASASTKPGTYYDIEITVEAWVRNDSTAAVLLFRGDTPDVTGYDDSGEVQVIELYGSWHNTETDMFLLQPGERVAYTTTWQTMQNSVDATTWLYSSPDVGGLNAVWNEANPSCGTPLLLSGRGPHFAW